MPSDSHTQRVAANLRAEMARSKHTQSMLSKRVGMRQQALSRRLAGKTQFTIDELGNIAEALGIPLAALIGETAA